MKLISVIGQYRHQRRTKYKGKSLLFREDDRPKNRKINDNVAAFYNKAWRLNPTLSKRFNISKF